MNAKANRAGNLLLVLMLAGIGLGLLVGLVLPEQGVQLSWLGTLFIDALKMTIAPLILATLVAGMVSLVGTGRLGRFGVVTVGYYLSTTLVAVIIGMIAVSLMRPGIGVDLGGQAMPEKLRQSVAAGPQELSEALIQMLTGLVEEPIVGAMVSLNVMEIILFAILLGAVLIAMGERAKPLADLFECASDAMVRLVGLVLWLAPVGVFALIASKFGGARLEGQLISMLQGLGWFMLTVVGALLVHAVVLTAILAIVGRRPPGPYALNMAPALITAFSSASSSATLPITMDCAAERNRVSRGATGFVLPLGATVNMDGTAMYEAVAVIFMAQAIGLEFSLPVMVVLCVTATMAGIGAAGIPEAGLVTMVIVVKAVGLPEEAFAAGLGVIFVVDWFLDRCRTTVNVWGDAVGAAVVDRLAERRPAP